MAGPEVLDLYPADGDVGIPVGATFLIYFDKGVDIETARNSIILYGSDSDRTSGPDSAMWQNVNTGANPFFLTSPGFKGVVPLKINSAYYLVGSDTIVDFNGQVVDAVFETDEEIGHVLSIKPDPKFNVQLAANTQYILHIIGDPADVKTGISKRTIFDPVKTVVGDGDIVLSGSHTGLGPDLIHVKITKAGDIGVAKYKWWFDTAGEPSAKLGLMVSPKSRTLIDGIKIRFTGSNFLVNDTWAFGISALERMAASHKVTFTTNDGSFTSAPESPSTPATSVPPSTVLPLNARDVFEVKSMLPEHTSYNVDLNNRIIVITFSEDPDPVTITQETVRLWSHSASGHYGNTRPRIELQKTLELDDNVLTIRF